MKIKISVLVFIYLCFNVLTSEAQNSSIVNPTPCSGPDISPVDIQYRIDRRYDQPGKIDYSIIVVYKNIGRKAFVVNPSTKIEGVLALYSSNTLLKSMKINSLGSGATTQLVFKIIGEIPYDPEYYVLHEFKGVFYLKNPSGPTPDKPNFTQWVTAMGKAKAALDCNIHNNQRSRSAKEIYDLAYQKK